MKYLQVYKTHSSYEESKELIAKPYIVLDGDHVHFAPKVPNLVFYYNNGTKQVYEDATVCKISYVRETIDLIKAEINDGVTSIDLSMFDCCANLVEVTLPNTITSIPSSMFFECTSLPSITIPDSVVSIGSQAFYGCTRLTSITYKGVSYTTKSALTSVLTSNGVVVNSTAFNSCGIK